MADFRQPTDPYMVQEHESERIKQEQVFFGGYRRSLNGPMMPGVEAEGSWINSRHNPENAGK